MTHLTWKRWGVAAVALSVVAVGLIHYVPSAVAALNIPPPGAYNPCRGFKSHPLLVNGGPLIDTLTEGGIGVEVGTHFKTADGRSGANLIIRELRSAGRVDGLGYVEIGLDAERSRSARSLLVANQAGSDYPATQTMRFVPTVTIEGKTYRGLDVANLTNSAVKSTPPPAGTVYSLTNDVRLEDPSAPGKVAFTIKPGKAFQVTGHDF